MTTPDAPTDVGVYLEGMLLEAAQDSITWAGLEMPALVMSAAGVGVPTTDPCDGMLWVRVASVYPTDGSGAQFTEARIDFDIPAWTYAIELGVMFCHAVIDTDGYSPDPKEWSGYAARDGNYRMALLNAVAYLYPAKPLVKTILQGQRIEPWAPIGPDGGYSGGLLVSYGITNGLAICP